MINNLAFYDLPKHGTNIVITVNTNMSSDIM